MYWRLLDCLTTARQQYLPPDQLKDNVLITAVGAKEKATMQTL
jgi:hypothetical protein